MLPCIKILLYCLLIRLYRALEEEMNKEQQAIEQQKHNKRRRRKARLSRTAPRHSGGSNSSDSNHSHSPRYSSGGATHHMDEPNSNNNNNNNGNNGGLVGSLFACKLPYAFPRAYPEDSSDDEETHVRPPPVVPHRAGPSCSHPILDQEIEGFLSFLLFLCSFLSFMLGFSLFSFFIVCCY